MYQTMQEIEAQYDGKFVCIINYKEDKYYDIIGGEVIAASEDQEAILDAWAKSNGGHFEYIGEFPDEEGGFLL
ncbi:MAG: hypothetical protein FWG90_11315 [Oscillospiraceae bacterium]|nr:hypothetical protein [Oscillospiraceae bacterium]